MWSVDPCKCRPFWIKETSKQEPSYGHGQEVGVAEMQIGQRGGGVTAPRILEPLRYHDAPLLKCNAPFSRPSGGTNVCRERDRASAMRPIGTTAREREGEDNRSNVTG